MIQMLIKNFKNISCIKNKLRLKEKEKTELTKSQNAKLDSK